MVVDGIRVVGREEGKYSDTSSNRAKNGS